MTAVSSNPVDGPVRQALHAQVLEHLGRQIVAGQLTPGDSLTADDVATQFGVSRTVVREAFRVLEAKGLVTARPGVGTRVMASGDWDLIDPEVILWRFHSPNGRLAQMRELLELRDGLEPLAARLAARHTSPAVGLILTTTSSQMVDAAHRGDFDAFTSLDIQFHGALLRASGNGMLERLKTVVAVALRARGELFAFSHEISDQVLDLHKALAAAITRGDEDASESAMKRLLAEADRDIAETLRLNPQAAS